MYKKAKLIWKKEGGKIYIIKDGLFALNEKASFIFENAEKNLDELFRLYKIKFKNGNRTEVVKFLKELEKKKFIEKEAEI